MVAWKLLPLCQEQQDRRWPKSPFLSAGSSGRDGDQEAPSSGPGAVGRWLRNPYIWAGNSGTQYLGLVIWCPLHLCNVESDAECMLLAVMAFDRNKAISNPLLYTAHMSSKMCSRFQAWIFLMALADALINTVLAFCLCFCGSNEINHFFCDAPALLLLSCSDTWINEWVIFIIFGFIELSTISGVLVSYWYIILPVLKICSAEGRFKAFSTYASHLTAVAIFQGTILFMYFQSSSSYSLDQDKMTSLFYTLVIPMLNPLIYSLQNKDVKEALEKLRSKRWF
ncbi:Olfactory receptor-like protein OLF2 [Heterocephalus glaber]|uniref:Olfactory receptor-like protein OLF2 n=1 Tax=Heterocephalus glaber TaxID=10181 RepID=G5C3Z5_HETGA|nr:Olfactory receptor-like protein OLF2 [Heterocephalus glaber]